MLGGEITLGAVCQLLAAPVAELEQRRAKSPFEASCVHGSGETVETLIGMAFLDRSQTDGKRELAVFIADLSHQKRSEEVLRRTEKLAVAGRLAASIAHEINNPLAAITNCLYLVEQSSMDETTAASTCRWRRRNWTALLRSPCRRCAFTGSRAVLSHAHQ